jgi:N6-adenosine-specific RNA methylase IME4
MTNSLVIFTRARELLAEANTIQKAKELKDLALTAKEWAKRKDMGDEAIQHCTEYSRRAEIRMGEMLLATARAKGARESGTKRGTTQSPNATASVPTLKELGISKRESADAQMLAEQPSEIQEDFVVDKKTKTQLKREKREEKREEKRRANRKKVQKHTGISELEGIFATILIDPPWDWKDEGDVNQLGRARPDYATMTKAELLKLPIKKWADKDCHLYCWVTNRSMPKVFELLDTWGFRYVTLLTWPKPSFGMGNYFRGQTEHVAFGVTGSQSLRRKNASTLLPSWPRGKQHSSKPLEFYTFIESCSPGPYLELFGRGKARAGWVVGGADAVRLC